MSLFGDSKVEKELARTVELQAETIRNLTNKSDPTSLRATYIGLDSKNNFVFYNLKSNKMAQTIVVPFGKNTVAGQIVPEKKDGVTTEPITSINPGSEVYTSSDPTIATAAAVTGGAEGQFTVTRVSGATGSVTVLYTAVRAVDGATITNLGGVGDTFQFQGEPDGTPDALTATYSSPS